STLNAISTANVASLAGAWHTNLEGGNTTVSNQQSTPVVVNGVMYVQMAQQDIFAIDAKTGAVKWKYAAGGANFNLRGVGIGQGKVFSTLSNKRVVALDQNTGQVVWQTTVLNEPVAGAPTPETPLNPGDVDPAALANGGSLPTAVQYFDGIIYFG